MHNASMKLEGWCGVVWCGWWEGWWGRGGMRRKRRQTRSKIINRLRLVLSRVFFAYIELIFPILYFCGGKEERSFKLTTARQRANNTKPGPPPLLALNTTTMTATAPPLRDPIYIGGRPPCQRTRTGRRMTTLLIGKHAVARDASPAGAVVDGVGRMWDCIPSRSSPI